MKGAKKNRHQINNERIDVGSNWVPDDDERIFPPYMPCNCRFHSYLPTTNPSTSIELNENTYKGRKERKKKKKTSAPESNWKYEYWRQEKSNPSHTNTIRERKEHVSCYLKRSSKLFWNNTSASSRWKEISKSWWIAFDRMASSCKGHKGLSIVKSAARIRNIFAPHNLRGASRRCEILIKTRPRNRVRNWRKQKISACT